MRSIRDNPHIAAAAAARRPTRWWAAVVLGVVFSFLGLGILLVFPADEGSVAQ